MEARFRPTDKMRLAVLLAVSAGLGAGARAEDRCASIAGGSEALAAIDAGTRLSYIQRRLNDDAHRVRIWAWSWAGVYSGLVAANAIRITQAANRDQVIDSSVATAASAFGLVVLAAMPPKVLRDQPRLARLVARSGIDRDRCSLLRDAETLLLRDAASEAFGRGPLVHVGNFVFNVGLGLMVGVGFGHFDNGAIIAFTGIAVGELQMATVRTRTGETLARYRTGRLTESRGDRPSGWTVAPLLGPQHGGLTVGFAF